MRQLFHGWRRRCGCLTLVMAVLLSSRWLRGLRHDDVVVMARGRQKTVYLLGSNEHGLVASSVRLMLGTLTMPPATQFAFQSVPNEGFTANQMLFLWSGCKFAGEAPPRKGGGPIVFDDQQLSWHRNWQCCGLLVGDASEVRSATESIRIQTWVLPYWMLVIPLTLLSMWLLVWQPKDSANESADGRSLT
ncbi:MAG: hypothetical protein JWP89_4759 [Schlesneria sp.]|nr:hypothetical protein [Schlesneria sp.]